MDGSGWKYHEGLRLFVPRSALEAAIEGEEEDGPPAIAFFESDEALRMRPWPVKEDAAQRQAHETALEAAGGSTDGYASWLSLRALKHPNVLAVRETTWHMGTRIWAASWLHRAWALESPELFGRHVMPCACDSA